MAITPTHNDYTDHQIIIRSDNRYPGDTSKFGYYQKDIWWFAMRSIYPGYYLGTADRVLYVAKEDLVEFKTASVFDANRLKEDTFQAFGVCRGDDNQLYLIDGTIMDDKVHSISFPLGSPQLNAYYQLYTSQGLPKPILPFGGIITYVPAVGWNAVGKGSWIGATGGIVKLILILIILILFIVAVIAILNTFFGSITTFSSPPTKPPQHEQTPDGGQNIYTFADGSVWIHYKKDTNSHKAGDWEERVKPQPAPVTTIAWAVGGVILALSFGAILIYLVTRKKEIITKPIEIVERVAKKGFEIVKPVAKKGFEVAKGVAGA